MNNMKYVVLEERPPKDGTGRQPNRALIVFDGRISDTVICAGVSRDHQNFSDCNIVEKGAWEPTERSKAEVDFIVHQLNSRNAEREQMAQQFATHLDLLDKLAAAMGCRPEPDVMLKRAEFLVQLDSDMQALLEALGGLSDPHHRLDSSINPGPERDALQEVYGELVSGRPAPLIAASMKWPEALKSQTAELFQEQYLQTPARLRSLKDVYLCIDSDKTRVAGPDESVDGMLKLDLSFPCQVHDLWEAIDKGLGALGISRIRSPKREDYTRGQWLGGLNDAIAHLNNVQFSLSVPRQQVAQVGFDPALEGADCTIERIQVNTFLDDEHLNTTFHPLDFDKKREI